MTFRVCMRRTRAFSPIRSSVHFFTLRKHVSLQSKLPDAAGARAEAQFPRSLSAEELAAARTAVGGGGLGAVFVGDMAAARLLPVMTQDGLGALCADGSSLHADAEALNNVSEVVVQDSSVNWTEHEAGSGGYLW